jgi:hypothetical protein
MLDFAAPVDEVVRDELCIPTIVVYRMSRCLRKTDSAHMNAARKVTLIVVKAARS